MAPVRPPDVELRFANDVLAARLARLALARLFADPHDPVAELVMLAASELVTNVVLHTDGGGEVRVWDPKPDVPVRLEVSDGLPPPLVAPREDMAGGRGLAIVERISSAWGVAAINGGKMIWVEFDRTQL